MARSTRKGAVSSTGSGAHVIRDMVGRSNFTPQPPRRTNPFSEIGTSGLRQFSGWVMDEWLGELTGREAAWRYREFLDNDPVAGGFLFAVEMLARRVTWSVEGGDPRWREFIAQCMNDMSHPWVDLVSEALTMLPYGYAPMELVYKRRQGGSPRGQLASNTPATEEPQDEASSVYDDGLIGWRKIPLRAQETTLHWDFDGYSSLRGLIQLDWHGQQHNIPIEKMVLFRYRKIRNNPEGYSVLRRAWTSYFRLRGLQDIEAIGAARDLAGIPVAKPPPGVDLFAPENQELYNRVVELVTTVHRDEDEGLVFPTSEWEFELMSAGGSRQFDTDKIIRRYEQRIAASVLADFMLLGQDGLGSYAMVDVKSELFGMAIDAVLDAICEPMNRYAIPRLLKLNGIETSDPPQITHTTAGRIDLEKIGSFLNNLALAGAQIPWDRSLMTQLFNAAGLPMSFDTPQVEKPGGLENEPVEKKPLEKGEGLSLIHDVQNCARCGEDHTSLSFRKLGHSVDGDPPLEYWATCPETDEPIMLGHANLEKADARVGTGTAMVSLDLEPGTLPMVENGVQEHHLTVVFLGKDVDDQTFAQAVETARSVASRTQPLTGTIGGLGQFPASEASDGKVPVYAKPKIKGLAPLRAAFEPLNASEHGDFKPHVTLTYLDDGESLPSPPPETPVTFTHLSVHRGEEVLRVPFGQGRLAKTEGEAVDIGAALTQRANVLSSQLDREITAALQELGSRAGSTYLSVMQKDELPSRAEIRALARRVINALNLSSWVRERILPLLRNHGRRTARDTERLLHQEADLATTVADSAVKGTGRLSARDFEPQIRQSIIQAIEAGLQAGENPSQTAERIRRNVPAGRFTKAGSQYRSRLIAHNETAEMLRQSSLAAYRSNPRVSAIKLRDGIYGPPRSDSFCIDRDGDVVPIAAAPPPAHVNCTLGYLPVVQTPEANLAPA